MTWTRRAIVIGAAAIALFAGRPARADGPDGLGALSAKWKQGAAGVWEGLTSAKDAVLARNLGADAPLEDAAGAWALADLPESATLLESPGVQGANVWIFRVPQEPHGITYVGVLRIGTASGRWQVEVTCREVGTTGGREAVLLDRAMGDGSVSFAEGKIVWKVPPEDVRYDAEFPKHPLARLRKVLGAVP